MTEGDEEKVEKKWNFWQDVAIMSTTFAVIKTGGKQYQVAKGDVIKVEKIEASEGDKLTFDEVLLHADGDKVSVGTPGVSGKKVQAKVIEQGKGDKLSIIRFFPKSNYRRKVGHRQPYTKLLIESI